MGFLLLPICHYLLHIKELFYFLTQDFCNISLNNQAEQISYKIEFFKCYKHIPIIKNYQKSAYVLKSVSNTFIFQCPSLLFHTSGLYHCSFLIHLFFTNFLLSSLTSIQIHVTFSTLHCCLLRFQSHCLLCLLLAPSDFKGPFQLLCVHSVCGRYYFCS